MSLAMAIGTHGVAAVGAKGELAPTAISIEPISPIDDL
jgi:hypothetical protein